MNLGSMLEALGAAIHQDDDAPPRRRGGGRAQSPIPPAGSVKRWQPPAPAPKPPGRRRSTRRPLRPRPPANSETT